ncbi:site-specific integrase [uncultured Winogradskyella sp.]|uniref:tyrosine-type recombinase/integrase n=1 Tax=uncultured Winogradskyella sp. TaxID=395353 RepID=UPI0030DC3DB8
MQTIHELITLGVQNEHDLEHDLEHKTLFSAPKIFDASGDLTQRWYVYYSYRNPKTGRLKRMKNVYGNANRFKTKESRYSVLNVYKKRLLKFLKAGYNPFEDNTDFHQNKLNQLSNKTDIKKVNISVNTKEKTEIDTVKSNNNNNSAKLEHLSINKAFAKAIMLKTNIINVTTLRDYKSRLSQFENWLKINHSDVVYINEITKKMVVDFLNSVQLKTSARNRNNYRTVFSSLFQLLEDNELIEKNFIKSLKPLKTKPKRNKSYSLKEQESIFEYLELQDPLLLLYIKFISYNLLRPIEVCRLRIKDINVEQRILQFQAKNKVLKTKTIPEILLKELPDLSKMEGNLLLFTPKSIGGTWVSSTISRRDHFSKRFKFVVKDKFEFGEDYGLYSFRHTFITKLYKALIQDFSTHIAKSKLMQITGHSTMVALDKYLRDIDAELADDYSKLL